MNIYKILFSHTAPKDTEIDVKCLLLAENDEQVYEWIKKEPKISNEQLFNGWREREEDGEVWNLYDKSFQIIGTENFKERIIKSHGEMFDDEYDYSDAYYGIKLFGWELLVENTTSNLSELQNTFVFKAI